MSKKIPQILSNLECDNSITKLFEESLDTINTIMLHREIDANK